MLSGEADHTPLVNQNSHARAASSCNRDRPPAGAATRGAGGLHLRKTSRSLEIRRIRHVWRLLFVAAATVVPFLFTISLWAAEPKRVLIVHSFGRAMPTAGQ